MRDRRAPTQRVIVAPPRPFASVDVARASRTVRARERGRNARFVARARALDSHLSRSPRARRQRPRDGYPNPNRPERFFRASLDMRDVLISRDVRMPTLAFGTYRLRGDECRDAVREALAVGFRHVDTATCYRNERAVAEALAATSLATSSETFITSKISPSEMHGEAETTRAIEGVVERLGRPPSLLLVHWPGRSKVAPSSDAHREARACTWRAFERALRKGMCRAIGVSNYEISHLEELLAVAEIPPAVNQIELHPRFPQVDLRRFCAERRVRVVGYSPLGVGALLTEPRVVSFAEDVGLPPAPALVRWSLARAAAVVVKSSTRERAEENFRVYRAMDEEDEKTKGRVESAVDALERAFERDRVKFCWDPATVS